MLKVNLEAQADTFSELQNAVSDAASHALAQLHYGATPDCITAVKDGYNWSLSITRTSK